jgi:hypothetical protein
VVATGAPQYADGARGDLWHGRINSAGAAGFEVTVRLDVQLPALGGARNSLQVPSFKGSPASAYRLFQGSDTYHGVGRGARPAVEKVSKEERFSVRHCSRCMKRLSPASNYKAVNAGATYWVCGECDQGLRARRSLSESKAEWDCPTAREGGDDCTCCTEAKKPHVCGGKRPKGKGFYSSKQAALQARQKQEAQELGQ